MGACGSCQVSPHNPDNPCPVGNGLREGPVSLARRRRSPRAPARRAPTKRPSYDSRAVSLGAQGLAKCLRTSCDGGVYDGPRARQRTGCRVRQRASPRTRRNGMPRTTRNTKSAAKPKVVATAAPKAPKAPKAERLTSFESHGSRFFRITFRARSVRLTSAWPAPRRGTSARRPTGASSSLRGRRSPRRRSLARNPRPKPKAPGATSSGASAFLQLDAARLQHCPNVAHVLNTIPLRGSRTPLPWDLDHCVARAAARFRSSYKRRCSPRCTPLTVITFGLSQKVTARRC